LAICTAGSICLRRRSEYLERREPGKVVFLGDYVDRGHESREVVQRLLEGPPAGWKWVCLQGNHEAMMLECIRRPGKLGWWLENGGAQTLVSYGHAPTGEVDVSVVPQPHLDWLSSLPLLHVDRHRIFVHAGVDPALPLDEQRAQFLQWHIHPEGHDLPVHARHVVHGHEQFTNGPILLKNRTNLDVFAWRTGRLVVGAFDDDTPGGPIEIIEIGRSTRTEAVNR
jgi:serine/threonine protein phosphatase 1